MTPTFAILADPCRPAGYRVAAVYVLADYRPLEGAAVIERRAIAFLGTLNARGQHVRPYRMLSPKPRVLGQRLRQLLAAARPTAENPAASLPGAARAAA
jgi:hypothetical protein